MGWNMESVGKAAQDTVNAFKKEADTFIQNTTDDINHYIEHTLNCLGDIDQIRIRIMERYIQYETTYVRALIEAGIIPAELLRKVQDRIFGRVPPPPEPILFFLRNPNCVWTGQAPDMVEFDVRNENPRRGRKPFVFIHGASYARRWEDAYSFYKAFEVTAGMFKDGRQPDYDIYILSYDSDLTNETKLLIRRGIEAELGTAVEGESTVIYWAILWRELVARAHCAGEKHLTPLFHKIFAIDDNKMLSGYIISHSLGNEAVAFAAKKYYEGRNDSYIPICQSWWCMAAALPADAFTNTGDYEVSPQISIIGEGNEGTVVWFSRADAVLSLLYPMGNTTSDGQTMLALGVTGALQHQNPLTNLDVTQCTKTTHEVSEGYFEKIGKSIRTRLGTEIWGEQMCELRIPTRRD